MQALFRIADLSPAELRDLSAHLDALTARFAAAVLCAALLLTFVHIARSALRVAGA